jgi:hypothetical protein
MAQTIDVRLRCAYAACERVLTERVMDSKADIRARVLARRDGLAPEQRIENEPRDGGGR